MMIEREYAEMKTSAFRKSVLHPLLSGNEFLFLGGTPKSLWMEDFKTLMTLQNIHQWQNEIPFRTKINPHTAVIVTDQHQNIQWVNSYFTQMTGYDSLDAISKKPSFLQGKATSHEDRANIRQQLANSNQFKGQILNYKKNGEPYWCKVEIFPLFNTEGQHSHYIAFETDRV